jgi:Icc-related predicted phosphoesterase
MKDRAKTHLLWETIPDDTEILILHGPPKGIRDLSYDRKNNLEMCGDRSLGKRINKLQNLKLVCFGHIHNVSDVINQGFGTHGSDVIFSNAACSTDGNYEYLTSFGNIITLL